MKALRGASSSRPVLSLISRNRTRNIQKPTVRHNVQACTRTVEWVARALSSTLYLSETEECVDGTCRSLSPLRLNPGRYRVNVESLENTACAPFSPKKKKRERIGAKESPPAMVAEASHSKQHPVNRSSHSCVTVIPEGSRRAGEDDRASSCLFRRRESWLEPLTVRLLRGLR